MGHGTVMSGPNMMGHDTDPDMMNDPVVMPPVPWPGPDMIIEHSHVMTGPVVMPPVPRPGPDSDETQPASSAVHLERIDTMEDFEIQEQRLSDAQAFNILVEGIMKFDYAATEYIKMNVAEHLKHAPQRLGGGEFTTP
ncbi:unnamed protein product [Leuciscus chuanchicus]